MGVLLPAAGTFRPFLGNTLHPWCVTRIHMHVKRHKALSRVVVAVGLSIRRTLKTGHWDFQNQPLSPETGQYQGPGTGPFSSERDHPPRQKGPSASNINAM